MITKRTLEKWRKEALQISKDIPKSEFKDMIGPAMVRELSDRILRLTQVLIDQHLLRK